MSCPGAGVEDGDGSSEEESAAGGVTGGIDGSGVGCVGAGAGTGVGAGTGAGAREGGLGVGGGTTPLPVRASVIGDERFALMIEILPEAAPFQCGRKDTWKVCC